MNLRCPYERQLGIARYTIIWLNLSLAVVCCSPSFHHSPFAENMEEAGHIFGSLPCILAAERPNRTRLPDLNSS